MNEQTPSTRKENAEAPRKRSGAKNGDELRARIDRANENRPEVLVPAEGGLARTVFRRNENDAQKNRVRCVGSTRIPEGFETETLRVPGFRGRPVRPLARNLVHEVPDDYRVVVGTADDLEFVELQAEDSPRVLDEGPQAERRGRRTGIESCLKVPDFDLAVVRPADNPLVVEPDAPHQLLVSLEDPQTGTTLHVPKSDGVVRTSTDNEFVPVLEARDAPLVSVQGSDKFAGRRVPHLDGSVTRRRHDVVEVKVDDVDSGPVTEEHSTEVDLLRADDVPHGNRSVL